MESSWETSNNFEYEINLDNLHKNVEEEYERYKILLSSQEILKNTPEWFYDFERCYQNYRTQFSKSYFEGSSYNVGESLFNYIKNRPTSDVYFYVLNLQFLKMMKFYGDLFLILNCPELD